MPKRWNPQRSATRGACLGGLVIAFGNFGRWGIDPVAPDIAELIGGICAGVVIFGLGAVVRNAVVKAQ